VLDVAGPDHIDFLRPLIASGAMDGSWDRALASTGSAADGFLTKIGYALKHGSLPQLDPRTGKWIVTRIAGWVYRPDEATAPVGFGLFKEFYGDGFEFWLCAIAPSRRGMGTGRKMLTELMTTPLGLRAQLARCALGTDGGRRCARILKSLEFETCRTTTREEWLLHRRAPASVVEQIATMDMAPFDPGAPSAALGVDPEGSPFGRGRARR
jgi:hypothetical protein